MTLYLYKFLKKHTILLVGICCLLFIATALFYVGVGFSPSGDEPHYLIISQTLLKYRSLNVMLDYQHGDYLQFYPVRIDTHVTLNARKEVLPLHSIGGPVLWLLPFALLGRLGVVVFISLVTVLIILNIYKLLLVMGISERVAFLVSLAYAVASPLYLYAHLTFIEPLGTLACIYVARKIMQKEISATELILSSLLLGILPFVHIRFAFLEIPLFFALLYKLYHRYQLHTIKYYLYLLVPVAALFVLLEIYSYTVWGTLNPAANQIYGNSKPFEVSPFLGMVGILIDQEYGLLINFPVFLFLLPGLVLAMKRRFLGYNILVLLLSLPYIIAFTSFRHWSGGWCPPTRFILVLLPLYAFYLAYALEQISHRFARILFQLTLLYGFIYNLLSLLPPNNGFNAEDGRNDTLAAIQLFNHHLTGILPSVYTQNSVGLLVAWGCFFVLLSALLLVSRDGARDKWKDRVFLRGKRL